MQKQTYVNTSAMKELIIDKEPLSPAVLISASEECFETDFFFIQKFTLLC